MLDKSIQPRTVRKTCHVHDEEYEATECLVAENWVSTGCPMCEADERQEDLYRENQRRSRLKKIEHLNRAGIPKRFWARSFENYNATCAGQKKALDVCTRYANNFEKVLSNGICLSLLGNIGNGKTHLACAVGNQLTMQGRSVLFVGAYHVFSLIKASYRKDSEHSELEVIEGFVEPDLLIFEEVGVSFGSESERVWTYQVINRRYEEGKPTIIISNFNTDGLTEYLGDRAMDRLAENGGTTLVFDWKSYRRNK